MSTTKKTIKLFWNSAWKYPHLALPVIILVPLVVLTQQFIPPIIAANVLDRLSSGDFTAGQFWQDFKTPILAYFALSILNEIFLWRTIIYFLWKLEGYVIRDIQRLQFNHLMKLSASFHSNSFGGSLVSQTNKLSSSYIRIADTTLFHVVPLFASLIYTSIIIFPRSPQFVIALNIFSFFFIVFAIVTTKKIRTYVAREARASNKSTGILADAITNVLAVKSYASSKQENLRFEESTEEVRHKTLDLMWASIRKEINFSLISSGLTGASLLLAVVSVVNFNSEISTVFLVLSYSSNISMKLWQFSNQALRNYNRGFGDSKDGIETLELKPTVKDPSRPEKVKINKGKIKFDAVHFTHGDSKLNDSLFENLDFTIKPGEKIGLVGHSGSGKTTLTKLLLRFSDIDSGEILIDNQNIAKITQDDLRSHIAYVPQEPLLFHRTIAENIAYGKDNATQKEIETAAKQANAHDFVTSLSDGYQTLVGERGVKLSGGQRQRIAIARAFVKDAPILVLDEATSALDSESEILIQKALWDLMEGRTAIVIAHRLSTIQRMDKIMVMENGKVIENGSHSELLKQKGVYAGLWLHQSGGFIEE